MHQISSFLNAFILNDFFIGNKKNLSVEQAISSLKCGSSLSAQVASTSKDDTSKQH